MIVVDRYLRLMGDKTIPDSAEPRLESFYPSFVAGIDLPHQGVVDSYNPTIKGKVINLMSYMSVHICNTHVLISDDNIKYIKQYLE